MSRCALGLLVVLTGCTEVVTHTPFASSETGSASDNGNSSATDGGSSSSTSTSADSGAGSGSTTGDATTTAVDGSESGSSTTGDEGTTGGDPCMPNPCDVDTEICSDGMCVAPEHPAAGEVVFVELMPDPQNVSDTVGEWIELLNVSDHAVDLESCRLADAGTNGDDVAITTTGALIVPPGGLVVMAKVTDSTQNGGVDGAAFGFGDGFSLTNTGDEAVLRCDGSDVDEVIYTAQWSYGTGVAMQLDPMWETDVGNGAVAHWCSASTSYGPGVDQGTPGSPNVACP